MKINALKKIAIISTSILILDYILIRCNLLNHDRRGYMMIFEFILFCISVFSIFSYFILSDIKLNRFKHLKLLNYIATTVGMLTYIYWTFIKPDALHLLFPAYTVIFIFFNNLIMSFIYYKWKTGLKYIYDQWLLIITSIIIYIFLPKLLLM
jgi:hypothetical protein